MSSNDEISPQSGSDLAKLLKRLTSNAKVAMVRAPKGGGGGFQS